MLYALFMFWVVASISVGMAGTRWFIVWCPFIGRRRSRLDTASLLVRRHLSPPATPSH